MSTNHPLPRDFIGTVRVIADTADDLLVQAGIGTPGQVTERLVRFYVSTQLLDAPTKDGREAIYGALQLAKLVAVRVLLSGGLSLSRIKEIVAAANIDMCERLLDPVSRAQEMAAQERKRAEEINRNVQPRSARPLGRATRSMDRSLLMESQPTYSQAEQLESVASSSMVAEAGPLDDLDSDLIELAHLLLERPAILDNLLAGSGAPHVLAARRGVWRCRGCRQIAATTEAGARPRASTCFALLVVSIDDASHQRMAHHVFAGEVGDGNARHTAQHAFRIHQTAGRAFG